MERRFGGRAWPYYLLDTPDNLARGLGSVGPGTYRLEKAPDNSGTLPGKHGPVGVVARPLNSDGDMVDFLKKGASFYNGSVYAPLSGEAVISEYGDDVVDKRMPTFLPVGSGPLLE